MKQAKASILLVEDDPAILRGLTDVFVFHGFSIKGVSDGAEGLSEALNGRYDLAILDVMLPSLDGFSICRELRQKKPAQAIIMLTAKGAEKDIVTGFSAGADDYVPKPFSIAELMVRVEAVLRRAGKNLGNETVDVCGVSFDGATLTARCEGREASLTRREMDIVCYLSKAGERIVSKKELLSEVWQYLDASVETRTVDIHIQKLRKKIGDLTGDNPLIQTVRGEGYRIVC
ncbi:MAG: response regulator transcription factor [Thermodesulfobacteriota bacterium]